LLPDLYKKFAPDFEACNQTLLSPSSWLALISGYVIINVRFYTLTCCFQRVIKIINTVNWWLLYNWTNFKIWRFSWQNSKSVCVFPYICSCRYEDYQTWFKLAV
jgi:hypothetical protein